MNAVKCPSCGDAVHQHPTIEVAQRENGDKLDQPVERVYRCGECGRLYRHSQEK